MAHPVGRILRDANAKHGLDGAGPRRQFRFRPEGFSALVAKGDTFAGCRSNPRPLLSVDVAPHLAALRRCCAPACSAGEACRSCSIS